MEQQQKSEKRQEERQERTDKENRRKKQVKVKPYDNEDDVTIYMKSFEQTMKMHEIPEEDWNFQFTGALGGRVRDALEDRDLSEITYPKVRTIILSFCGVTPETE